MFSFPRSFLIQTEMTLKLVVTTNVNGDVFELVLKNAKYGVGRRHDNDLRIKETYISGYHAELIRNDDGDYELSDLGSSNGTFLNGKKVEGREIVKKGDFVKFGILKVAIEEHTGRSPKVVSLKDRAAFSKKAEGITSAITPESSTGLVGTMDSPTPSPVSGKSKEKPSPDDSVIKELKSQLKKTEERADTLDKEIAKRNEEVKTLTAEVSDAKSAAEKVQSDLKASQKDGEKNADLEKKLSVLSSEAEESKGKSSGLAKQLATATAALAAAKILASKEASGKSDAEKELTEAKKGLKAIETEKAKLEEKLASNKSALTNSSETAAKELTEAQKEAEALRQQLAEREKAEAALDSKLSNVEKSGESRIKELETSLKASESKAGELEQSLSKTKSEINDSSGALKSRDTEIKDLKDQLTQLQKADADLGSKLSETEKSGEARIQELKSNLKAAEAETGELEKSLEKTAAELQDKLDKADAVAKSKSEAESKAQEKIDQLNVEVNSLRESLSGKDSDLKATAAEAAKVAALTATIAVLTKDRDSAKEEIQTTSLSQKDTEKAAKEAQKQLTEQLKAAEKENVKLSKAVEKSTVDLTKQKDQVVTLKADLSEKNKVALSASKKAARLTGLTTELEDLKGELKASHTKLEEATTAESSAKETAAAKEVELTELNEKNESLTQEQTAQIEQLKGDLENTKTEKKKSDTALATIEEEKAQLEIGSRSDLEALTKDLDKTRSKLEAKNEEVSSIGQTLAETRNELKSTGSKHTSTLAEIATLTLALKSAETEKNRLSGVETELKATRDEQSKVADERDALEDELKEAEATRKELENAREQLKQIEGERKSLSESLFELKESGSSSEKQAADLSSKLSSVEGDLAATREQLKNERKALSAAKTETNSLRVDLKKAKESADKSTQEIEKDLTEKLDATSSDLDRTRDRADKAETELTALRSEKKTLSTDFTKTQEEALRLKTHHDDLSKNIGRLQAELSQETVSKTQLDKDLEAARAKNTQLLTESENLQEALEVKARELAEKDQDHARNESDTVQRLKRQLGDTEANLKGVEEKSSQLLKEKLSLSGAFERLKEQLSTSEATAKESAEREDDLSHSKGAIARRLEKAEASNSELASRIKEEATTSLANQNLVEKLELQLRDNESEAVAEGQAINLELEKEIRSLKREANEEERVRDGLQSDLTALQEEKRTADERILAADEQILENESALTSMRSLLGENEKKRSDLVSELADQTALAANHEKIAGELRDELAATITRFQTNEAELLQKHAKEVDTLVAEVRSEKEAKEKLAAELENTRIGLSEALRNSREESERAQTKLIAEGNAKLSKVEDELSAVIHARGEIEKVRNELEDALNDRDEKIEKLSEHIEDLDLKVKDEQESRHGVLSELDTTRAGFSTALQSNWKHLGETRALLDEEKNSRNNAEKEGSELRDKIEAVREEMQSNRERYEEEIRNWEDRYDLLREEKLNLATEDANLQKVRDQILVSTTQKREIETELTKLTGEMSTYQDRHHDLKSQTEKLVSEREDLKAGLNRGRNDLETLQKRAANSAEQEKKLSDTIRSAEGRIESLKKLEGQMEQVVERKRQENILSRSGVFSENSEAIVLNGDFSQEEFYKKLIGKLDLLDDLTKRYDNKWRYPKVADQLTLLKKSFLDFLQDHSVNQFDLEPGTVLSVEQRKRIKLVPIRDIAGKKPVTNGSSNGKNGGSSKVIETIRPGYVYRDGSRDVVIRKAEVVVA